MKTCEQGWLTTRRVVNHQPEVGCTRSGPRNGPLLALVAWTLLLVGILAGLHQLGHGVLAAPPLQHPGRLAAWAAERGPIAVAFALLRIGSELVTVYLLVTTLAGALTRAVGLARAARVLERLSVPVVRRLLTAVASVSLATAVSTGTLTQAAWAAPVAHAAPAPGTPPPNWSIPTMRVLGSAEPDQPPVSTWTIAPGQNLWSIAAANLARHWGRAPSDAEVDSYWHQLIAANRSRLAHPNTPDLVFAGQIFVLPPIQPK